MANITKTQIRKRLEAIKEMLQDLINDTEEERDDIEPYEGKDELTQQQEERYDWLDEASNSMGYALDNLEEIE